MGKIIQIKQIKPISQQLQKQNKKIVLVGGSFDILHIGHIRFLKEAKKAGDILFVEVESDRRIRKIKGQNRPINSQLDRAMVLSHLSMVDYVILLPVTMSDEKYLAITKKVQPDILATTKGDVKNIYLKKEAIRLGISVKEVIPLLKGNSSTKIIKTLGID